MLSCHVFRARHLSRRSGPRPVGREQGAEHAVVAALLGDGGVPPPELHFTAAGEPVLEVIERLLEAIGIGAVQQALGGTAREPVGPGGAAMIGANEGLAGGRWREGLEARVLQRDIPDARRCIGTAPQLRDAPVQLFHEVGGQDDIILEHEGRGVPSPHDPFAGGEVLEGAGGVGGGRRHRTAEPARHDFRGELVAVAVEDVLELDAEPAELPLDESGAVLRAVPHMDYVDAIDIEGCRRGGGIRH